MFYKIIIIDYGLGNIRSAQKSIQAILKKNKLNGTVEISSNKKKLNDATHIILPGQGSFEHCINGLKNLDGMIEALTLNVIKKETPLLGICVGMQLLANKSYENGNHPGLGWINAEINKIPNKNILLPHMGWNEIFLSKNHPVAEGLNNKHFYFVHSYYFNSNEENSVVATTKYGASFPVIVAKKNIIGCQFHPEKSSEDGLKLLTNFLKMK